MRIRLELLEKLLSDLQSLSDEDAERLYHRVRSASAEDIVSLCREAETTWAGVQSFFNSCGKLFHVFSKQQMEGYYRAVFGSDGTADTSQKLAICCLYSCAAVGIQYTPGDFEKGMEAVFHDVSRRFFPEVMEERPLDTIKVCTLYAMYNILNKATVALAYVDDWPPLVRWSLYHLHLLYNGAFMLVYRRIAAHCVRLQRTGQELAGASPNLTLQSLIEQGVTSARDTARIVTLLLNEQGVFKRCWIVIVAQRQLHRFPPLSWKEDMERAQQCIDVLGYCDPTTANESQPHILDGLDWDFNKVAPFRWDTSSMGILKGGEAAVEQQNCFLDSEGPSGWTVAEDLEVDADVDGCGQRSEQAEAEVKGGNRTVNKEK
ncbi:hypothetical protein NEMBOFW57_005605 [Staphylotrichum longicolle]|uniref:Uncharacterized protein n=1 Tax=Staphylotrichum longicolle TaxID=669026 RepID=A0AAD4EXM2_9PEZI|nr:hypothetical protein NEMBOFW57_005605 [Staphylotrichum longicolle]